MDTINNTINECVAELELLTALLKEYKYIRYKWGNIMIGMFITGAITFAIGCLFGGALVKVGYDHNET